MAGKDLIPWSSVPAVPDSPQALDWGLLKRREPTLGEQLTAVTRRAFIPRLFVEMYTASPVLEDLMRATAEMQNIVNDVSGVTASILRGHR